MEFFLTLADIGQSTVLPAFENLIEFFNTPLRDFADLTFFRQTVSDPPGWLSIFGNAGEFVYQVWNYIAEGSWSHVTATIIQGLFAVLDMAGIPLNLPIWGFLLSNLGTILFYSMAWKLVSIMI